MFRLQGDANMQSADIFKSLLHNAYKMYIRQWDRFWLHILSSEIIQQISINLSGSLIPIVLYGIFKKRMTTMLKK
jgi:hypothetical protein